MFILYGMNTLHSLWSVEQPRGLAYTLFYLFWGMYLTAVFIYKYNVETRVYNLTGKYKLYKY